jgi:hypothetical protein
MLHDEDTVFSICVSGVAHCVEDDDGELLDSILASEQCDRCGSTHPDGHQAPLVLGASGGRPCYFCEQCGARYRIGRTLARETVF